MKKCMSCMRDYDEAYEFCPVCGYSDDYMKEDMRDMPEALAPETFLGARFIIGRVLSLTDYSCVYIAWDALLQRRVVIREFFPLGGWDRPEGSQAVQFHSSKEKDLFESGREAFDQEALVLNRNQDLEEPINVYRIIHENNTSYAVMEYLDGTTLEDYLDAAGIPERKTAEAIFNRVVQAVDRIHERGIVHGNLAPENIYLDNDFQIRLIDFGLAKGKMARLLKDVEYFDPRYSAPEVLAGQEATTASDAYSLGMIYYTLLTGKEPPENPKKERRKALRRMEDAMAADLIGMMTDPEPSLRMSSIRQVRTIISGEG